MPNQIEKRINMQIGTKSLKSKYVKICKIKLHVLNHGTLKRISISSSIKYDLARLIFKYINLRVLIMPVATFIFYI